MNYFKNVSIFKVEGALGYCCYCAQICYIGCGNPASETSLLEDQVVFFNSIIVSGLLELKCLVLHCMWVTIVKKGSRTHNIFHLNTDSLTYLAIYSLVLSLNCCAVLFPLKFDH